MATDVLEAPPEAAIPDKDVTPAPVTDPAPDAPAGDPPAEETPSTEAKPGRPRGPDGKFAPKEKEPSQTTAPNETPTTSAVPDKYELALPKDSALPAASIERTAAIARELGLSNEAAQRVLSAVDAEATALVQAREAAWAPEEGSEWIRRNREWKDAALKDAEIGGTPERLAVSVDLGNRVLRQFFPPEVTDMLVATGWASNPAVLKGLAKIGRGMSESSQHVGGSPHTGGPKTLAERMYPNGGEGPKKTE